jgi:uncharacterized protein
MLSLPHQIRIATQYSENLLARLTGREPTIFPRDDLTSFAAFYERINTVLASLGKADKDTINASAEREEKTQMGAEITLQLKNADYAHKVILPNVYFHVTTAYGILRKEGVEIGKRDYYEGFFPRA